MVRHFELLGLPGSGKTTLLRHWDPSFGVLTIHQLIRQQRVLAAETHRRAALLRWLPAAVKLRLLRGTEPDAHDTARFIIDHPGLHDLIVRTVARTPRDEDRLVALWMLLEAGARHAYASRVGDPAAGTIVDEGIWQRLAFLLAVGDEASATRLPQLPERHPALQGAIVLHLTVDRAIERIRSRHAEFQRWDLVPAMAPRLELLVQHLRERGVPVLELDAEADHQWSVGQLRRFVAERMEV